MKHNKFLEKLEFITLNLKTLTELFSLAINLAKKAKYCPFYFKKPCTYIASGKKPMNVELY